MNQVKAAVAVGTAGDGNRLILYLSGRITSDNEWELRQRCDEELALRPHTAVDIDLDGLEYIASAGLRVLLEMIRREKDIRIVNAGSGPYEVLEMTGFQKLTRILKKPRAISVEGAKEIGSGFNSHVYRLDGDTIVKVYRAGTSAEEIEKELRLAKKAFISGIPTAISYDIVSVGDCPGVVFELLDCGMLRDAMVERPESFEMYMDMYAKLLRTIHSTRVTDPEVISAREQSYEKAEYLRNRRIGDAEADRMRAVLDAIPEQDRYLHGDCHFKNIMILNGEPMLIDMELVKKGSPLFDLSYLYCTYRVYEEARPGDNEAFFGVPRQLPFAIMDGLFRRLFAGKSAEEFRKLTELTRLLALLHGLYFADRYMKADEAVIGRIRLAFSEQLAKYGRPDALPEDLELEG